MRLLIHATGLRINSYTYSNLVQNIPYPAGIYDLHFLPGSPIFAISTTTGSISIFRILEGRGNQLSIEDVKNHQVFDEEAIVTSFAWYPTPKELTSNEALQGQPLLAATSSNGTVALVRFQDRHCVDCEVISEGMEMPVHERYGSIQYAYCCAWSGSVLFSGGDDSYLRMVRSLVFPDKVKSLFLGLDPSRWPPCGGCNIVQLTCTKIRATCSRRSNYTAPPRVDHRSVHHRLPKEETYSYHRWLR